MSDRAKHFIVSGPCRDYDETYFCEIHHREALEYASAWLEDIIDGIEFREKRAVSIEFNYVAEDGCLTCGTGCMAANNDE